MAIFKRFESARSTGSDQDDAATALALLGDDMVYPGLRAPISDDVLIDEALREHPDAWERMARMEELAPDDELYAAFLGDAA
jgi:hypothetical protein